MNETRPRNEASRREGLWFLRPPLRRPASSAADARGGQATPTRPLLAVLASIKPRAPLLSDAREEEDEDAVHDLAQAAAAAASLLTPTRPAFGATIACCMISGCAMGVRLSV